MIRIASVSQMRAIEAEADARGLSYAEMMNHAGEAVARRALSFIATLPALTPAQVTVLVGPGNNGGDGLVAGYQIALQSSAVVRFYLLKRRPDDDPVFAPVKNAGLFVAHAEDDQRYRVLTHAVASADILIDSLFGIGIQLPLRQDVIRVLDVVHHALGDAASQSPAITLPDRLNPRPVLHRRIIAVDCPSGLDCDTGEIDSHALPADETVTFIAAKPGLLLFPGAEAVGTLVFANAGVDADLPGLTALNRELVDDAWVKGILPARPLNGNKGTFGKVLVVGGSSNYVGAPGLAARAAYRIGAGLVTVAAPRTVVSALSSGLAEPTWLPCDELEGRIHPDDLEALVDALPQYDALVLGPGLGLHPRMRELIVGLLAKASDLDSPVIVDADALNALSTVEVWWSHLPPRCVLTPHPGEMSRLTGLSIEQIQQNRLDVARDFASRWKATVLLKGAHTVIASPERLSVLPFKSSALSTAGTGDVLAGMIGGLLGQQSAPHDAAAAAGYLHGLAGVHAASGSDRSVMAGDLLEALREVLRQIDARSA